MSYRLGYKKQRSVGRVLGLTSVVAAFLLVLALIGGWKIYNANLGPLNASSSATKEVTIVQGSSLTAIAEQLAEAKLIRSAWAFKRYAQVTHAGKYLQAGTYNFGPGQSVQDIVAQLTHGKVATKLITILPGQRLDKIKRSFVQQGFSQTEVDAAFEPTQYEGSSALNDKPKGNSLEGYIYPESFQRTATTTVKDIVQQAILQTEKQLTPDIRAEFSRQGLTVYQGLILASVVEKEVVNQTDRTQAAQVFIKRVKSGIPLGSDITAFYGSELAGVGQDVTYDSPYNTRIHSGFPPTPVSNVSKSSLTAVAHPADTDWLFFVAGDDGVTHFSKTVEEHEALTKKYCIKLCQ